ncbi:MAG: hypothetical protein QXN23_05810 [Candidatus Caldarchaeum sp.]|jgi:uncharacterized membrane protein YfhO
MPEQVGERRNGERERLTFERVWQAVREGKSLEVSKASDGRILVSARQGEQRVSLLLDRNEASGLVMALWGVLLR